VIEQQVAGSVDDDMRLAPAVRAFELVQAVDLGIAVVDFFGKRAVAEIRSAGVMDDVDGRRRGQCALGKRMRLC
jgi:hypothetical protein